jgi:hypothetical protein
MPYAFAEFIMDHESPGVIMFSQSLPFKRVIDELVLMRSASEAEEWVGRLVQINE